MLFQIYFKWNAYNIIKQNSLVASISKIKLCQINIRFLRYNIYQGTIRLISRSIEFANIFPDEIKYKTQFKNFLGCINYISDFIPNLRTTSPSLSKI